MTEDMLGMKLQALERLTPGLPASMKTLCRARMAAGHRAHGGRPFTGDWQIELSEELADGICYLALGEERSLRVRLAARLLGCVWRLTCRERTGTGALCT